MNFRWVIFLTLWTLLSGPIFGPSTQRQPAEATPTGKADAPARPPPQAPR
jgi:hypothetical protein